MDISINKNRDEIVTTSIGTSSNPRNQVLQLGLHHFNPPSLNGNLIKQRQAWEEHKVIQGTKGCGLKYKLWQQWTIVFLLFNSSPFQCIQRVPYIVPQWGNGRLNLSDLKAYGRPRDK